MNLGYLTDKTQFNLPEFEHPSHNTKSAFYSIQNNEAKELKSLPVNTNTLSFPKPLNSKLNSHLYLDRSSLGSGSTEFKSNLIYFYCYYTLSLLAALSLVVLLRHSESLSTKHFKIHLICILVLVATSAVILILVQRHTGLLMAQKLFLGLSYLSYSYFIIADERVLCKITGENYESRNQIYFNLFLVTLCPMLRYVFFDCFFYVLLSTLPAICGYLIVQLSITPFSLYSSISEVAFISIFLLIQIIETYRIDLRIKQAFWRQVIEVDTNKRLNENQKVKNFGSGSEVELIVDLCEKIKSKLKEIRKIIMYKDIKVTIKSLILDIEKIKWKSVHYNEPKVHFDSSMDEQDKEYIKQICLVPLNLHVDTINRSFTDIEGTRSFIMPSKKLFVSDLEDLLPAFGTDWNFDIHFIIDTTGRSISIVGKFLLSRWTINEIFSIPAQVSFKYFESLEKVYKSNPYHNAGHASDVLHTFIYFIMNSSLQEKISSLDLLASIIATLGHDVGHPGVTNRFLINNKEDLALQYNDNSVLENMHCSTIFSIMKLSGCNILDTLERSDWFAVRNLILSMVLGTDMAKHFEILSQFRARALGLKDLDIINFEDKKLVLTFVIKCADLGHSAKTTDLHLKWSYLLTQELFVQGDLEKERFQTVSMYCDRESTDVDKSQAGFLKNICIPLYESFGLYLSSENVNENCIEQQQVNLKHWLGKANFLKSMAKVNFLGEATVIKEN